MYNPLCHISQLVNTSLLPAQCLSVLDLGIFTLFSSQIIPSCEIFLGSSVHSEHWLSDTFVWNSPILSADFSNFPNPALHQAEENKSRPYWITYYLPLWLFLMLTVELNTIGAFGEVAVFCPSAFFERSIRTFASTMFFSRAPWH